MDASSETTALVAATEGRWSMVAQLAPGSVAEGGAHDVQASSHLAIPLRRKRARPRRSPPVRWPRTAARSASYRSAIASADGGVSDSAPVAVGVFFRGERGRARCREDAPLDRAAP